MASFDNLSTNDKIVGGTAAALIIFLLFIPWHSASAFGVTFTASATESPNGIWGVLALLVTIAILVRLVLARLTSTELPDPPMPWAQLQMFAAATVLGLLLLKLVVETEALAFGAWGSIILAAAMTYGAFQASKEPTASV